jgi:transposase-like protein
VEDYPRNLSEFDTRFASEEACREYLFKLRWPDGFCCPRCGGNKSWPGRGVLREYAGCGYESSVTAGTIFQDTRTPLRLWFQAMWWMTTQKNGASALGLQRVLGLKQYQTASTWLHKLRSGMVRPGRDLLTGRVEVDECYLGGLEEGLRGRLIESKALIIVAAQEDGMGIGRIRLRLIPNASADSLHRFILDSVTPGSVIHTDGWRGYSGLETKGYVHQITVLNSSSTVGDASWPQPVDSTQGDACQREILVSRLICK